MAVNKAKEALAFMRIHVDRNTDEDLQIASNWALIYLAENQASAVGQDIRRSWEAKALESANG